MTLIEILLLVVYMAVFSRMAGGGVWTNRPPDLAEALFAVPIALTSLIWAPHGLEIATVFGSFLWAYGWMQTGHATAFHMGAGENFAAEGRKEFLSVVIDPLCRALRQPLGGSFYCWAFMGLKGLLLHSPLGLYALPMALLWPLAYFIGNRLMPRLSPGIDGENVAEFLAGAISGAYIAAKLIF